jgi:hypothetical protein
MVINIIFEIVWKINTDIIVNLLRIYGLFNDAFSSSDFIASNVVWLLNN